MTRGQRVTSKKARFARALRRTPTASESRAWQLLRNRRLLGLKWRRQQVVRGFIVDFLCVEHRLVLEIDGGVHDLQRAADAERTRVLEAAGLRVLRVPNEQVCTRTFERLVRPHLR